MKVPALWPWQLHQIDFQPDFYLSEYQDVREAGIDPYRHFRRFGYKEARLPHPVKAPKLEQQLWSGSEKTVLPQLHALIGENSVYERALASYALARWYAADSNWQACWSALNVFFASPVCRILIAHPAPDLLAIAAAMHLDLIQKAKNMLKAGRTRFGDCPDFTLASLGLLPSDQHGKISACLNSMWHAYGLQGTTFTAGHGPLFDRLRASISVNPPPRRSDMVSIVVPTYNSGSALTTALHSLCAQSHTNLDIIVVDDGSTDNTPQLIQSFVDRDARIKMIRLEQNMGAYPARNVGLAAARGSLLTVHDADDWSHPDKISSQVDLMYDEPGLMACMSHWARMNADLRVNRWRITQGWVHKNMSSTMMRRAVLDRLGYYDRVRAGGDKEYLLRIEKAFGHSAIGTCKPGIPLAFGRSHAASLTQNPATHLRTTLNGVRRDYITAASLWHNTQDLYLKAKPSERPFAAPDALRIDE